MYFVNNRGTLLTKLKPGDSCAFHQGVWYIGGASELKVLGCEDVYSYMDMLGPDDDEPEERDMWEDEDAVDNVPEWIDGQCMTYQDVKAITQGGCASGAYMPAVTYYDAAQTMANRGDEVLSFIENHLGEVPKPPNDTSWSGMACFYLSTAVELWACGVEAEYENG